MKKNKPVGRGVSYLIGAALLLGGCSGQSEPWEEGPTEQVRQSVIESIVLGVDRGTVIVDPPAIAYRLSSPFEPTLFLSTIRARLNTAAVVPVSGTFRKGTATTASTAYLTINQAKFDELKKTASGCLRVLLSYEAMATDFAARDLSCDNSPVVGP
jgi:hypothetical protein